jgi:Uma2 family endonuclease
MTYTSLKLLTFDDFLARYSDNLRYELADGELIDMEPTGPRETVGGKLATKVGIAIIAEEHPWVIPRTCLIRPALDVATVRRPDIVVLDETSLSSESLWEAD